MNFIYTVIENGDPYLYAYTTYTQAVNAVKSKHKETLLRDLQYTEEYGMYSVNVIDIPEASEGPSYLYIEKGINIYIYKLPIAH
jgi:hypothetical protein